MNVPMRIAFLRIASDTCEVSDKYRRVKTLMAAQDARSSRQSLCLLRCGNSKEYA